MRVLELWDCARRGGVIVVGVSLYSIGVVPWARDANVFDCAYDKHVDALSSDLGVSRTDHGALGVYCVAIGNEYHGRKPGMTCAQVIRKAGLQV